MDIASIIFKIPAIIIAVTLHEFTRALVSTLLGDARPKRDGRLTLNPVKHFEPIGFIIAFATGCGWGKPVETSALHYKNRKAGIVLTAVMPSVVNMAAAVAAILCINRLVVPAQYAGYLYYGLRALAYHNIALAVYNIVPVPPMDGEKVLSCILKPDNYFKYVQYEKIIQVIFLLLLFMGYAGNVFDPIITGTMRFISIML